MLRPTLWGCLASLSSLESLPNSWAWAHPALSETAATLILFRCSCYTLPPCFRLPSHGQGPSVLACRHELNSPRFDPLFRLLIRNVVHHFGTNPA